MGLNASGDFFCARTDQALSGIDGVFKLVDDILAYGACMEQLKRSIIEVFQRCRENHITLFRKKIPVGTQVKFAGFIISPEGVGPDPAKISAISEFPSPTNLTDLRSFMRLVNQLGQLFLI
jgi:hypothetical protein